MYNKILLLLSLLFLIVTNTKAQNTSLCFIGILEISDSTHIIHKKEIKNYISFKDSINISVICWPELYDSYIGYPYFDAKIESKSDYLLIIVPEQEHKFFNDPNHFISGISSDSAGYINLKEKKLEYKINYLRNGFASYSGTLINFKE